MQSSDAPIVLVAIDCAQGDVKLLEALREAVRRTAAADERCRFACATVVPPAAALQGEGEEATATGRHIKHLVMLRQWARPLELPEERLTYHVLESDKPAAALVDYAAVNEVDEMLIGAPHRLASVRLFLSVAESVVRDAPCSVKVVRAPARD